MGPMEILKSKFYDTSDLQMASGLLVASVLPNSPDLKFLCLCCTACTDQIIEFNVEIIALLHILEYLIETCEKAEPINSLPALTLFFDLLEYHFVY